jgi:hypothetical protein
MAYDHYPPAPERSVSIGCQVPRPLAAKLQAIATAKGVSLSKLLRAALVQVYAPEECAPSS